MAWLYAVPKPAKGSKRAEARVEVPQISRRDRMKKDGIEPAMPSNPLPHVVEWLIDMGITEATGMGPAPLSWREIDAWQRSTAITLSPWEAGVIRKLSVAYMSESAKAESENCPAPWHAKASQREIDAANARLRMVLG